jgi:hypothetical protein
MHDLLMLCVNYKSNIWQHKSYVKVREKEIKEFFSTVVYKILRIKKVGII